MCKINIERFNCNNLFLVVDCRSVWYQGIVLRFLSIFIIINETDIDFCSGKTIDGYVIGIFNEFRDLFLSLDWVGIFYGFPLSILFLLYKIPVCCLYAQKI